jgi:hypothetical protein
MQPALGIEDVAQREEVVLAGAPPVVQHEQSFGIVGRGPLEEGELRLGHRGEVTEKAT